MKPISPYQPPSPRRDYGELSSSPTNQLNQRAYRYSPEPSLVLSSPRCCQMVQLLCASSGRRRMPVHHQFIIHTRRGALTSHCPFQGGKGTNIHCNGRLVGDS